MKDIKIIKYFIFVDDNRVKLAEYKTIDELMINAKGYVSKSDDITGKSETYIGIGAEFWILENGKEKEFVAIDFINRFAGKEKFNFCRDIKTLELKLPTQVEYVLEYLIEVL